MISTIDLNALRSFIAVVELSSFSRAAEALRVSPSALSQIVRGLEERAGTRLLNRTTRSMSLTEAGRALLERVQPAIQELGAAIDQLRAADGRPAGTVRIHAFRIAAELFLAPMLESFARDFPEIVLDIAVDDTMIDIVAEGFDAAIRLGEVIQRDMVAIPLGPELRQLAVASPGYLAEHGKPVTPHDLLQHRCIRWRWPGQIEPYAWEFCEAGRWFTVAVEGPVIASSREFGINAAVSGVGIAFAVEEAVARHIAEGRLVPLLEQWAEAFPGFFLCYPQQRNMAPALRAFVDALRRHPVLDVV